MPDSPDLDRIARAIYRGMGYSAPWGSHPDRVVKMRVAARAVLEELGRAGYPIVAKHPQKPYKVLKATRE